MATKRPAEGDAANSTADTDTATPRIGAVGYRFRKHFPGHGVFKGKVVEIRPGAEGGKDRRCVYEDGDIEDLSLSSLHKMAQRAAAAAGQRKKKQQHGVGGGGGDGGAAGIGISGDKPKKKKQKRSQPSDGNTKRTSSGSKKSASARRSQHKGGEDLFAGLDALVPIDRAAEATLFSTAGSVVSGGGDVDGGMLSRNVSEHGGGEEDETGAWLAKVAAALGASEGSSRRGSGGAAAGGGGGGGATSSSRSGGRKRSSKQTSPCASRSMSPPPPRLHGSSAAATFNAESMILERGGMATTKGAGVGAPSDLTQTSLALAQKAPPEMLVPRSASPSSSVSMDCLSSLADIAKGVRHGTRVFRADDKKRLVGEVILEHGSGYVEVVIGKTVEKARLRNYIIAPEEYNVGDNVPSSLQLSGQSGQFRGAKGAAGKRGRPKKKEGDAQLCRQISAHGSVSSNKGSAQGPQRNCTALASPSKRSSISSEAPAMSPCTSDETVSLSDLFYWCCDECTMANAYNKSKCSACNRRKGSSVKKSALLEVASIAVAAAETVEEASEIIPMFNREAVPKIVLSHLISLRERKTATASDAASQNYPSAPKNLDAYFYWICGFCTLKNSFRRSKCNGCQQRRGIGSASSVLLDIATKASQKARTISEASNAISIEDRTSIPNSVLSSLVTCIAIVGSRKSEHHRCRNAKAPGVEYCSYHCNDPLLLSAGEVCGPSDNPNPLPEQLSPNEDKSLHQVTVANQKPDHPESENKNFESLSSNLSQFFERSASAPIANNLRWHIRGMEDAILCQETGPFPLGLMVRRFFTQYGFHDGRIIKVLRQNILDPTSGRSRPVLVYRVLYNDGDCEDFMHHEINSLRQIYDRCNVDSTAHPSLQIAKGSQYETHNNLTPIVMVEGHRTPTDIRTVRPDEGGTVDIKFCKEIGQPWTTIQSDLKKLQTSVIRMLPPEEESVVVGPARGSSLVEDEEIPGFDAGLCMKKTPGCDEAVTSNTSFRLSRATSDCIRAPLLEWPGVHAVGSKAHNQGIEEGSVGSDEDKEECEITSELWLTKTAEIDVISNNAENTDGDKCNSSSRFMDDESCVRSCLSRPQAGGWDPGNALPYVQWDPFKNIICDICNVDKDDHQILLCDSCHLGYHMYCVRPVIVNVPTTEWFCSRCRSGRDDSQKPFSAFLAELEKEPTEALKFLHLSYNDPTEFYLAHQEGLDVFSPKTNPAQRRTIIGIASKSKPTAKIGSLHFSWNIGREDFVIPKPPPCPSSYNQVLLSWVSAMKYAGMTSYSEELVYPGTDNGGASESMNDASLENMQPLNRRNLEIFKQFKENLKHGAFPPIRVVHDSNVGFTVEALADIRKHTLIAEYIGEVTTIERSGETSSDSLMMLLDTGDDATSLIIDPTRKGNIARFLSGINNRSNLSKKKANVRTRRFALDGKCRVALFTAKKIEAGEKLHYDYNAGVEGKTVVEWAKTGFYDTSNFF